MADLKKPAVGRHYYTRLMKGYRRLGFTIPLFNPVVRLILRLRFWFYQTDVFLYCRGREKEIEKWYQEKEIFFGLAIIRSGTTFLADFFNRFEKSAIVGHEVILDDYWSYAKNYNSAAGRFEYLKNFRRAEIYYRLCRAGDFQVYGEINPFLRRHVRALREVFPEAKFFHLVRDGREVVRSIMSRGTFSEQEPIAEMIRPTEDSPYFSRWEKMSRFAKVCWLWQEDNRLLRITINQTVQLEKIISDYCYFKENLLDYLKLDISEKVWRRYVRNRRNPSPEYKFPEYSQWSSEQKEIFWEICGSEMKANGYPADSRDGSG